MCHGIGNRYWSVNAGFIAFERVIRRAQRGRRLLHGDRDLLPPSRAEFPYVIGGDSGRGQRSGGNLAGAVRRAVKRIAAVDSEFCRSDWRGRSQPEQFADWMLRIHAAGSGMALMRGRTDRPRLTTTAAATSIAKAMKAIPEL